MSPTSSEPAQAEGAIATEAPGPPSGRGAGPGGVLFELEDVTKTYGAVRALSGLTLAAPVGAVGLLGPNGAGKTTMIRALLGLIRIDSGAGAVLGRDILRDRMNIRQRIGFVPEDECLFPGMEGVEFAAYAGQLSGMRRTDALQRSHEVLDYVGLGEARYRKVDSYSTGMKQRLKIASALVHDPELVILDEPTNGMDPAGRVEVLELARDLTRNKGISLVFSSHLLPDVEAVCEHVIVLGRGRLLASGSVADLTRSARRQLEVRIKGETGPFRERLAANGCVVESIATDELMIVELPDAVPTQAFWRAAMEAGCQVRLLKPRRSTLEEVFLRAISEAE